MELKKPRWFISIYTGWLQNIYGLGLQYEKRHITLETLRINLASLYHGQIIYKNNFSYSGVILWNKLPYNVRKPESLAKFKCLLKQVL